MNIWTDRRINVIDTVLTLLDMQGVRGEILVNATYTGPLMNIINRDPVTTVSCLEVNIWSDIRINVTEKVSTLLGVRGWECEMLVNDSYTDHELILYNDIKYGPVTTW